MDLSLDPLALAVSCMLCHFVFVATLRSFICVLILFSLLLEDMTMGQNQWYHFGVGAPPILVRFSGDWDVHWLYGIFTPWPCFLACILACWWQWLGLCTARVVWQANFPDPACGVGIMWDWLCCILPRDVRTENLFAK